MWQVQMKSIRGKRHRINNMICQDRLSSVQEGSKTAVALVDGVGTTDLNAVNSEKIAECATRFLIDHFEEIMKAPKDVVSYNILKKVYEVIESTMIDYGVTAEECASTLMCMCVDSESKQYCAIHLGDGIIMSKHGESEWRVLSRPQNGMKNKETSLTISKHAQQRIKVYRNQIGNISEFFMCSDGVYSDWKHYRWEDMPTEEKEDDQSIIFIRQNEEE